MQWLRYPGIFGLFFSCKCLFFPVLITKVSIKITRQTFVSLHSFLQPWIRRFPVQSADSFIIMWRSYIDSVFHESLMWKAQRVLSSSLAEAPAGPCRTSEVSSCVCCPGAGQRRGSTLHLRVSWFPVNLLKLHVYDTVPLCVSLCHITQHLFPQPSG